MKRVHSSWDDYAHKPAKTSLIRKMTTWLRKRPLLSVMLILRRSRRMKNVIDPGDFFSVTKKRKNKEQKQKRKYRSEMTQS